METNKPGSIVSSESECKRLLEIANLSLYRNNSFRVLNVPVDASERTLARHIQTLKFQAPDAVDSDRLQEAYQRIRNLEFRAADEFFWFWTRDESDFAYWIRWQETLRDSDEPSVLKIGRSLEPAGRGQSHALHNCAVAFHSLALAREAETLARTDREEKNPVLDFLWKKAFDLWGQCIRQEQTWDFFKDRIRAIDDPRLTTGFVRRFRGTLPLSLCLINIQLALNCLEKGAKDRAAAHLNYVKQSGMDPEVIESAWRHGCGPVLEPLRLQCQEIKRNAKQDPRHANELLRRTYGAMEKSVSIVVDILPEGHPSREPVCDEIASAIYECQIAATADGGSLPESLEWLQKADALPLSPLLHHRLQENIRVLRLNLDNETCWFCKEFLSAKASSLLYDRETETFRSAPPSRFRAAPAPSLVPVPRCSRCESYHSKAVSFVFWGTGLGGLAGGLLTFVLHLLAPLPYAEALLLVSAGWGAGLGFLSGRILAKTLAPKHVLPESAKMDYPKIKDHPETVCQTKQCCAEPSH